MACPAPFGKRFRAALSLVVLLLSVSLARAEEPMATQPEECIFFGAPSWNNADCLPEENLFLMSTQSGIHAFDTRSGAQRWHHPQGANMAWGRTRVVGWTAKNELFVLDKATGRELWWRREGQYGHIEGASLMPDETRIMAIFDVDQPGGNDPKAEPSWTNVLYSIDSQRQRVFGDLKDAVFLAFLNDSKTALCFRAKARVASGSLSKDETREFFLVDLDSGKTSEGRAIPVSHYGGWGALSASGLLVMTYMQKDGPPTGLKLFDVRSGVLVRDLGEMPKAFGRATWSADEKCLYFITCDQKEACVLDAQTGALQQTLSRPGHTLFRVRIQRPEEGPDMVLSQDEDRNFWLWPPTPDATPTKVFDGRRIEPGTRGTHLEDGEFLTAHTNDLGVDVMTAYQIEGMQRKGVWRLPARSVREEALFNRPLTHCVNRITNFRENGRTGTNDVEVYASGGDGPLFSGKGDPLALSPDGRFFMVQTAGKRAVLQDLQEKRTVHTFDAKADWDTQIYVAFSDDGRRVAVNAYPNLEVVDLTEGFPRRTMAPEDRQRGINCSQDKWHYGAGQSICFSPDGTLLLSGGYGRAWLHDAATGALLHTFIETAHFYEAQPYTQGSFMKSLEQSARDWAGVVTDAYKGSGPVHVAFGAFGDHAITHAGGKIIRVWDSRSGALINTIETGLPEKRNANWFINNRIVFSGNGEYALAYNRDNFAPASLLSLADGTLIRRYKFPDNSSFNIALSEDGKSVYLLDKGDLNRWPGRPKDSAANP